MDGIDKNANASNNKESTESKTNLIEGYEKIEDFTKDGFKALVEATKNSNSLPQERDWDYYNTHESFKNLMTTEGNEILQVINNILKQQSVFGNIKNRDLDEKIELVIEANDVILERVANNLDELAGIRKNPQLPVEIQTVSAELPISGSWNKINSAKIIVETSRVPTQSITQSPNSIRLLTGKNIERPQKYFKDRIDNSKTPWEPRIKDKPNNLKPLAIYLEYTDDGTEEIFCHPYEFELERFEPSQKQLTKIIPSVPRTLDDTPLHLIENPEQIDPMLQDLRKYHEISIDLEHHSYRSYMGITCLMQISTGETDYLVDTLKLRDKLHVLNEVFTKPSVVKVFHGADMDILWLQRDLSLYIVNMFDTHQAAKQLGYPHLSLAYLLRRFCQIDADKHFQLADWRIRPLPEELKTYAREDTHYLLYIYHMMRNELLTQGENVLKGVITSSTQICKKRYEKPIIREDSHMELYRKCKKLFDNRQMFALKHLYQWRDDLAREEDESTGFVLPNHMMLQIAELLPREMQGILACCNPIPPMVRANLLELHKIILKAREQSVIKPILSEDTRNRGNTQQTTKINIDNVLNCPHDLLKTEEFRDDLPTLLGSVIPDKIPEKNIIDAMTSATQRIKPKISIFETPENSDDEAEARKQMNTNENYKNKMNKLKFLGPYERYKLVKSYMLAEEKKIEENQNKNDKDKDKNDANGSEDKSNAERLAALQEHFKVMAAATNQKPPAEKLPKEMNTGKETIPVAVALGRQSEKRKRCDDDDDEYVDPDEINYQYEQLQQQYQQHQQQQHHQQQQNNNKKKKQRNKKKPNNNSGNNANNVETLSQQKKSEKRNKKRNKQNAQAQNNNQVESQPQQQQQQQQRNRRQKQRNQQKQQQQQQQNQNNQQERRAPKRKRTESNNRNDPRNSSSNQQQQQQQNKRPRRSENFQPFDYSAVNFQQFQGGAGSAHQPKNVASNFKSRGSKNKKSQNIDRSNTKSATFGGNNNRGRGGRGGHGGGGGDRGRGRGRGGNSRGSGRYYK